MNENVGSQRDRIHQVTDLQPATLASVAQRVAEATSFEDFVYRESEVDAIWTQVDIKIQQAELDSSPDLQRWQTMRERLWRAHDLLPEGRVAESAAILRSLIDLL